jgi:hypothetical protein
MHRLFVMQPPPVIPAKAGIQAPHRMSSQGLFAATHWIPAFAGMTDVSAMMAVAEA